MNSILLLPSYVDNGKKKAVWWSHTSGFILAGGPGCAIGQTNQAYIKSIQF